MLFLQGSPVQIRVAADLFAIIAGTLQHTFYPRRSENSSGIAEAFEVKVALDNIAGDTGISWLETVSLYGRCSD